jgi:hypothetical protein
MPPEPPLPLFLSSHGYRTQVVTLGGDRFYWHVWRHEVRVNGGLSDSWTRAHEDAAHASRQDFTHRNQIY